MGHVAAEVSVELTFSVESTYTMDAWVPEWDLYEITSITYSKRELQDGTFVYKEHDLLDAIKDEEEKKVFLRTLIKALLGSKLEEDFGEAITQEIDEDQEPDYDPHDNED